MRLRRLPILPGRTVPGERKCENHPERSATHRIIGEEDSCGCEWLDLCDECHTATMKARSEPNPGKCDFCGEDKPNVGKMRDTLDEGLGGPVYRVCDECARKYHHAAHEELKELACWNPDFQDPDRIDWDRDYFDPEDEDFE
jgi:hypothetical protein